MLARILPTPRRESSGHRKHHYERLANTTMSAREGWAAIFKDMAILFLGLTPMLCRHLNVTPAGYPERVVA